MGSWVGGQKGSGHKECPLLTDLRKGEAGADLLRGPQLGPRTLGANVLYHVTLPHFSSHSLLVHIRAHDLMGDGGKDWPLGMRFCQSHVLEDSLQQMYKLSPYTPTLLVPAQDSALSMGFIQKEGGKGWKHGGLPGGTRWIWMGRSHGRSAGPSRSFKKLSPSPALQLRGSPDLLAPLVLLG